jgi:hypothetical protein
VKIFLMESEHVWNAFMASDFFKFDFSPLKAHLIPHQHYFSEIFYIYLDDFI